MINEDIAGKTVRLAISMSKLSGKNLYQGLKKFAEYARKKVGQLQEIVEQKAAEKDAAVTGKQSVKDLIQQGQTLNSMDISDEGIRDFFRIAKKYGVDYAVVKDTSGEQPKYVVFFKAKDIDVIEQVLREYAAKRTMKQERQDKASVREKLKKFRKIAKNMARKEREKRKEYAR
jgi:uncharacterized protein YueI